MLNYAILNEAWGSKKKQTSNNEKHVVLPVIQNVQDPLVIRITDKNIIENLKIYKEDYKQTLIINVLKNYFENKINESSKENVEPEIEYMAKYNDIDMSDDMKEVMYIMIVLIFVLYFTNKLCGALQFNTH